MINFTGAKEKYKMGGACRPNLLSNTELFDRVTKVKSFAFVSLEPGRRRFMCRCHLQTPKSTRYRPPQWVRMIREESRRCEWGTCGSGGRGAGEAVVEGHVLRHPADYRGRRRNKNI